MRLEVSRRADLAVQALRVLYRTERCKSGELASRLNSTVGFMAHVMNPLVKAGLVASEPGPTGGYRLTDAGRESSVLAVIEMIDGPTVSARCVVEDRPCGAKAPCSVHQSWVHARTHLMQSLESMVAVHGPVMEPT